MTNRIALVLGIAIVAALTVDHMIYGNDHAIFLGKRLFDLIEWLAFWR
ncbi:hypothetical protein [Pseudoprimorskyibacter insulae]|uniref:Uncharacterized protein n=1 Tax=Pseudoprimorskyibacter insulae TaxID=1695997 RepID=A0A2R8AXN1_9RHOB|nr:hypothetical protein [Pseudoprimorskyibacter insulae]SPF80760.1 hypothetical protein PRI8871_02572 [Pseudoprimorskyibacter insulae]